MPVHVSLCRRWVSSFYFFSFFFEKHTQKLHWSTNELQSSPRVSFVSLMLLRSTMIAPEPPYLLPSLSSSDAYECDDVVSLFSGETVRGQPREASRTQALGEAGKSLEVLILGKNSQLFNRNALTRGDCTIARRSTGSLLDCVCVYRNSGLLLGLHKQLKKRFACRTFARFWPFFLIPPPLSPSLAAALFTLLFFPFFLCCYPFLSQNQLIDALHARIQADIRVLQAQTNTELVETARPHFRVKIKAASVIL